MDVLNKDERIPRLRFNNMTRQVVGTETVVWNPAEKSVVLLNETAEFILSCCDGATTVGEMTKRLLEEFAIDSLDIAEQHLADCLNDLVRAGFLEI